MFKSVFHHIKTFFHGLQWKETVIFLFFLLLSTGFWYLQSLQEDMELEMSLPVKYKNVPAHITLTDDNPQAIVFRVKDKGLVMLSYLWLYKFAPLEVSLKNLREETNGKITVARKTIESGISRQLTSSTSLLGFEPQTIELHYEELGNKELPVVADISVSPEPGFQQSGDITVTPDKVLVYANKTILDTLHALRTVPAELKNADSTRELTLRLQSIAGVRMDEHEVKVKIPVEEFTEKRLVIPVVCEDVPAHYMLHVFPSEIEVICQVPVSRFGKLTEKEFEIRIPFQKFEASRTEGQLAVCLSKQPSQITPPTLNPATVEFIMEQRTTP
ncbi:MAG: YbbR-like domain-containing protein [Tannerella sp.]|nr:YbbR-like domain-containing protein [Tannerella sp.]